MGVGEPRTAQTLVDEYNQKFNNIVLRDYSAAGEYLSLPGLAETFTPRLISAPRSHG